MDPVLIDISNAFYTGNYQQCINLSEKIKVRSSENIRRLFGSKLALLDSILETSPGERHLHVPLVFGHKPIPHRSR